MKNIVAMGFGAAFAAMTLTGGALAQGSGEFQDVQDLANRWTQAYNSHDRGALGGLYTETAQLYAHGSPTVSGRVAIEDYWADDMQVDNPLTVLTVTHVVNGVDMKLVHGDYQVIGRDSGVPLGHGRFAHIWVLTAGEWRLDRDLWNQPYDE